MYKPTFEIRPFLLKTITEITEKRTWIAQSAIDVPWITHLQKETSAKIAHSSTAIEGNPLDLYEVEAIARGEDVGGSQAAQQEVKNYLSALKWIRKNPFRNITEKKILDLHKMVTKELMEEQKSGVYKSKNNRIIDHKGYTIYTPPPPEECPMLTQQLIQWIDERETKILHPLIASAIVHHRLVSIHPFSDGNGRTARLLALWLLYRSNFDTYHIFALDNFFEEDRQMYYTMLQQARELDNNLTYWIEYVAIGMLETLSKTQRRIQCLQINTKSPEIKLTQKQEELLNYLRENGKVRSPEFEKEFKISRARVSQLTKPLVEANLITKEGNTRATTYRLAD